MARQFNDVVSIDLKTYKDVYFIHFSDMHTRFHKSKVIRRKTPKNVVDSIATEWIGAGFGPPKKFLIDNGGEFDNEEYKEICEQFNIEICATAAYSPWSNGTCERNHYVVDVCVQKMLEEDPKMTLEVALAWAVNAKNSMQNHLGFSPIQLVVGCNPNLPCAITNNLPAQEEVKVSDTVRNHLNALHSARRAFTKAESSDRIKRALKHNVRVNEEVFIQGDKVFYKRDDCNRWRGPGKIVGQDGKILFIRHGSQLVRVATCRAIKVDSATERKSEMKTETKKYDGPKEDHVVIEEDNEEDTIEVNERNEARDNLKNKTNSQERKEADMALGGENNSVEHQNQETRITINNENTKDISQNIQSRMPKSHERIRYKSEENEEWTYAKVIGKGGKSTGKNKNYVNVRHETDDKMIGVHLDKCLFEILDEDKNCQNSKEQVEANNNDEEINITYVPVGQHLQPEVIRAKEKELDNWKNFEVYTEVPDNGQKTISTRWVITEKLQEEEKTIKARLVVRGFEEEEAVQSDSPTAAKSTLRLVIAIAANENWNLETIDIKAAFLQGKLLDRDIFIMPPKEVREEGTLWKLNKVAYGLGDASRNWFFSVKEELIKLGMKQSKLDGALFRYFHNGELQGIFVTHVDDFLFCGTSNFNTNVIEQISKKYRVGKRLANNFKYVGINITNSENGIFIDQEQYADELEEIYIPMHRKGDKLTPLTKWERKNLMTVAGQLNWLATQTRPDLSYEALELNMSKKDPIIDNLNKANKAIRQAKKKSTGILFSRLGKKEQLQIIVYSDAAWGNLPDGTSSGQGHIIFLCGEDKCCPLSWTSNKIKRKVSSSLAAETLALHDSLDEAIYLNGLLTETLFDTDKRQMHITARTDNKSLCENIHSTKQVQEKRLRINIAEIRRLKDENEVSTIAWIETRLQLADMLTKRGVDPQPLMETFKSGKLYAE